jgi:hypothetical protein
MGHPPASRWLAIALATRGGASLMIIHAFDEDRII